MIKKNLNLKKIKLTFRKLKLSDYKQFEKLFYLSFKKKISYDFFKWRYFNDELSFCYAAFDSSNLVANVGIKSLKLNNENKEIIFSRHSSMVLKRYRGLKIYSQILQKVRKKFFKYAKIIFMWPNKDNFASFGFRPQEIFKKNFYLYRIEGLKKKTIKTSDIDINKIYLLKNFLKNRSSFIFKDLNYFKKRYLDYRKQDYFINKFDIKKSSSFFILKKNKLKKGFNIVILDHFGSKKIKSKHFSQLINEKEELIFLSKKKNYNLNYKLINHINLLICLTKKNSIKNENQKFLNGEFMLGDTDSFITLR